MFEKKSFVIMETDDLSQEISDFSSNQSMSAEARGQQSHDIVDKDVVRSAVYVFDFPSQDMKDHLASPQSQTRTQSRAQTRTQSDVGNRNMLFNGPSKPQDKYMRLDNELEQANQKFIEENQAQQQLMMQAQDEQIDLVGSSVGVLKNMSQQISGELDEQAVMLDDFAHEMDTTESKMDNVMKKMAKVLHMSNDKRQWCAIGVLLVIMVIVIILFFVL